jgi:hypothetical protein
VQAAPDTTKGTWWGSDGTDGTLRGRDVLGNPVSMLVGGVPNPDMKYVYDTVLDLTWLANWNANGPMDWTTANAWATSLTDLGGGWALPSVLDTGAAGCNYANSGTDCGYNVYGSEVGRAGQSWLAQMWYVTLSNNAYVDASGNLQSDHGLANTGPFSNMQSNVYWSRTAYAPSPADSAWCLNTRLGFQGNCNQRSALFGVAVRSGDVLAAPIPEPGIGVLMGLGLAVVAVARRRRTP